MSFKKLFLFISIVSSLFVLFFMVISLNTPSYLNFIEGREYSLDMGMPISAEFDNENVGVVCSGDKEVSENININLSSGVAITPTKTGGTKATLSLFGIIPVKTVELRVMPDIEVVPCGNTIGVVINSSGIMVLGTGMVENETAQSIEPAKGILKSGDIIIGIDGQTIAKKEELSDRVKNSGGSEMTFNIKRGEEVKDVSITPVKAVDDGEYKIGIWVRDSTQGIGTMTYYNPQTNMFGALGHGVYDVDTKKLMSVKTGRISRAEITGVKKGEKGEPGEIVGSVSRSTTFGTIVANTEYGLYGELDEKGQSMLSQEKSGIVLQQDLKTGEAYILTDIIDGKIDKYKINIESINYFSKSADKGMVIEITDERLISQTNGIIQGMSGSPIIQDGKLVGAVTHVFVQEPQRGYGIFIENMLQQEMEAAA